jgi:hypothetical protein
MAKPRWETYVRPARKRLKRRWRRAFDGVRYLLMRHWHPIGGSVPPDEYDRYALTIAGMLLRDCPASELSEYLAWAERRILGQLRLEEAVHTTAVEQLIQFRIEGYPPVAWNARFPGTYMLPKMPEH